jgi:hypothetical protein
MLAIVLTALAFKAEDPIANDYKWTAILMVALSILPGPITLAILWIRR